MTDFADGRFAILGLERVGRFHLRHRVVDRLLGVERTLKRLRPPYDTEVAAREALSMEAVALSRLEHPNLERFFDVARDRARGPGLVLQQTEGVGLGEWSREHGRLVPDFAMRCVGQVAAGLVHAHGRDVVHGDVHPDRIVMAEDGSCRLVDFLGPDPRFRVERGALGAPEVQVNGVCRASDVYALAATALELTGDRPRGDLRHWPAIVVEYLRAALERDPSLRPSATELYHVFRQYSWETCAPPRRLAAA